MPQFAFRHTIPENIPKDAPFEKNGFLHHPTQYENVDLRLIKDPERLVTTGNWVLIKKRIPVETNIRPQTYGIYWAMPYTHVKTCGLYDERKMRTVTGVDEHGQQCALIYTPKEVKIFPDEYNILSEEKLEEFRDNGWQIHTIDIQAKTTLNQELIEQGRDLCEEEREIIWSLMLDGLSEQQACEEYFLTHHSQNDNVTICYLLPEDQQQAILNLFGE